ncbi:MAG: hypothetical protein JNK53_00285, partial [Phycisphaerae bacterium]|nr:hypothetical protein [Phycisphaerae bacterium]
MTQPTTPTPPQTAGAPRKPAPAGAARRTPGATIDPVRILRQHMWLLIGSGLAGAVMGVVVNYVQLFVWPVWSGTVVFEINPEISGATEVVRREITQEEAVARVGQTESRRLVSKSVLEAAMKAPDISNTQWGQKYPEVDERIERLEDTLKASHLRGTSNFVLTWSTQNKGDIPVVLNRVASTYIDMRRDEDNEAAVRSLNQFEEKKRALDEEIRRQSDAIQTFIAKYGLTGTNTKGGEHLEMRNKIENLSKLRDEAIQNLTSMKSRLIMVDRKIEDGSFEEQDRRTAMEDLTM